MVRGLSCARHAKSSARGVVNLAAAMAKSTRLKLVNGLRLGAKMGYRVKVCRPGRSPKYLAKGLEVEKDQATYMHHPSQAKKAIAGHKLRALGVRLYIIEEWQSGRTYNASCNQ
jgi:hypothetical protein